MPRKGILLWDSSSDEDEVRIIISDSPITMRLSSHSIQTPEARRARTTIVMDVARVPWVSALSHQLLASFRTEGPNEVIR